MMQIRFILLAVCLVFVASPAVDAQTPSSLQVKVTKRRVFGPFGCEIRVSPERLTGVSVGQTVVWEFDYGASNCQQNERAMRITMKGMNCDGDLEPDMPLKPPSPGGLDGSTQAVVERGAGKCFKYNISVGKLVKDPEIAIEQQVK